MPNGLMDVYHSIRAARTPVHANGHGEVYTRLGPNERKVVASS